MQTKLPSKFVERSKLMFCCIQFIYIKHAIKVDAIYVVARYRQDTCIDKVDQTSELTLYLCLHITAHRACSYTLG